MYHTLLFKFKYQLPKKTAKPSSATNQYNPQSKETDVVNQKFYY